MDPNEELEVRNLMKKVDIKKVPERLLENYESEVLRRIKMAPGIPYGILFSAVTAAAVCAALGTWIFIARVQPAANLEPETQPVYREIEKNPAVEERVTAVPVPLTPQVIPSNLKAIPAESQKDAAPDFKKIADDLFILEMLGEDEGVLDSMDRAASDIEIGGQVGTVAF